MRGFNFNWRVGSQIRAPKVRVIGADGKQLGVLPIEKALLEASDAGLSLVEIAPKANPPVVKIVELGKFKYQEEKKLQKQKRGSKVAEIKEIRFTPFIAEHDFLNRLEKIKAFLEEKHKIRIVVKFGGRQLDSKEFGYRIIKRIIESQELNIVIDMEPKFMGRHLIMIISPTNKFRKESPSAKATEDKEK